MCVPRSGSASAGRVADLQVWLARLGVALNGGICAWLAYRRPLSIRGTRLAASSAEILSLGGEIRFQTKVEDVLIDEQNGVRQVRGVRLASGEEIATNHLVMAIGHSARDTFEMLY